MIWIQQFYSPEDMKLRIRRDFRISFERFLCCFFFSSHSRTKTKVVIITVMIFSLFTSLLSIWSCAFLRTLNLWWTQNLDTLVDSSFLIQLTDTWQINCLPDLFALLWLRCLSADTLICRVLSKKYKNLVCISVLRCRESRKILHSRMLESNFEMNNITIFWSSNSWASLCWII